MEEKNKLIKRLDLSTMIVPLVMIIFLCIVFMVMPKQSQNVLTSIRNFLGDDMGIYYVFLGVGAE